MGAGSSTSKHDFIRCGNDYELVIKTSKELEHILERHFNAQGRGLHEKISGASGLSARLIRDMRYLATIRNRLIHEQGFDSIPDREVFQQKFLLSFDELEGIIRARNPSGQRDECTIL